MNFLLLLVSAILSLVFGCLGFVYSALILPFRDSLRTLNKRLGSYFLQIALSIDQMGNVIMQHLFNDIMITKQGYKFGKVDETISSVLGKNQIRGTLKGVGKWLNWLLNKLDNNHSVNSIEADE